MARINVRNAKYALLEENTNESYKLGTKYKLPGLRDIEIAIQLATGTLYGDGVIEENSSKITGATVKIGINKIAIEDRARMSGAKITNGIMDVTTDDVAPHIALYLETESSKAGGKEQLWLLCGQAQPIGLSGQQSEANVNYSTDTMTIQCVKRKKDNKVLRLGDTESKDFSEKMAEAFAENPESDVAMENPEGQEDTTGEGTEGN